jgi:hypothetical protein
MQYAQTTTGQSGYNARASKYTPNKPATGVYSKYRNLNARSTPNKIGIDAIMAKAAAGQRTSARPYDLGAEYQRAVNAANRKNDQRDKAIQSGYRARERQANELIAGQGEAARRDLMEAGSDSMAAQRARLTGLGLGNTTVVGAMQQGAQARQDDAMQGLNESIDRNRLGILSQMSGDRLAYQERPNDVAPDLGQMIALAQMQGRAGGGGGVARGGGVAGGAPIFGGTFGMPIGGGVPGNSAYYHQGGNMGGGGGGGVGYGSATGGGPLFYGQPGGGEDGRFAVAGGNDPESIRKMFGISNREWNSWKQRGR